MITLDKSCQDILAKYLKDCTEGKLLQYAFRNKQLSKAEYLEKLYNLVDETISHDSTDEIEKVFQQQDYFEFKPEHQLAKLNTQEAACLIEPSIVKRIDAEGNIHYICSSFYKQGDFFIKKLSLQPHALEELYHLMDEHHYYVGGCELAGTNVICFGRNKMCVDTYKNSLKKSFIEEGGR